MLAQELSALTVRRVDVIVREGQRRLQSTPNVAALAYATGITRNRLGRVLHGDATVSSDDLNRILVALEIGPDERQHFMALWDAADAESPHDPLWLPNRPAPDDEEVLLEPGQAEADGFVQVNRWSLTRPLTRTNLRMTHIASHSRLGSELPEGWTALRQELTSAGHRGSVASVVAMDAFDYHETDEQTVFGLTVAPIDYASQLATRSLLGTNDAFRRRLVRCLTNDGFSRFLALVPPAAIAANINIVSSDGQALTVRRSSTVAVYPGQWNLGINETMNLRPDIREDFVELVARGAQEEAGIHAADVATTVISWFGFCFDCGNFYLFAHLFSHLPARRISRLLQGARDSYEHADHAWIPVSARALNDIARRGVTPDSSGKWLHHAPLSAVELWRSRESGR